MNLELMIFCGLLTLLAALWAGYEIGRSDCQGFYFEQYQVAIRQLAKAEQVIAQLRAEVKR